MSSKAKRFLPGISWFFILLVLLCIPGTDLPQAEDWMQKLYLDKWVHTGLFAILSFLDQLYLAQQLPGNGAGWQRIFAEVAEELLVGNFARVRARCDGSTTARHTGRRKHARHRDATQQKR